jgi:lipopolysaccharide transport system permease protein
VYAVLMLMLIVLGFSLAASMLFIRYRDLNQVWEVFLQAGFFLTPIVYPAERVPAAVRGWLSLWPPTAAIGYARTALLERRVPSLESHALLFGLAATSLVVGILIYRRYEPTIAEHV